MDENMRVDTETQRIDPYEDEIELMDLLNVLWKRKYLILIGTLVCAVAAAVISLNMTKVYGIETVLQPGMLKATEDGKIVYIDSPGNIKAVIETGALNGALLKDLTFPNKEEESAPIDFKVTIPKGTNAVEVLYETPYVDFGMQILKNMNNGLLERYGKLMNVYRDNYDTKIREQEKQVYILIDEITKKNNLILSKSKEAIFTIKKLNNSKSTLDAEIEAKKNQIKNFEERISEIEIEIGRISNNTDLLIAERNKFLGSKETESNILASVIYSNTIQQNITYLNQLKSTISETKSTIYQNRLAVDSIVNDMKDLDAQIVNIGDQLILQKESLGSEILAMDNERKNVLADLKSLKFKRDEIQNILIIKPPKASISPVKPKTRLNVMLAGVVGLFLTVFLAFFVEYISKHKGR